MKKHKYKPYIRTEEHKRKLSFAKIKGFMERNKGNYFEIKEVK